MVVALVATLFALAWLTHRASKLLSIPIPTLVKSLGLDLPAPPRVSLHGISADSITLHWSLPEKAGSVTKHIIQVNGVNVGESERRDTSVTVTGLNPDQLYNVRVIAANAQNFQAPGQLIRLRTRRQPEDSGDGGPSSINGSISGGASSLSLTREALDDIPAVHTADPSSQQNVPQARRSIRRQNSPGNAANSSDAQQDASSAVASGSATGSAGDYNVDTLTTELERVRKETEETEAVIGQNEEEHKSAEAVLLKELDEVRSTKKKEDTWRQALRNETKSLEEAKRAAEAQRAKMERALKAKQDEIDKMQEDCIRWDEERALTLEKVDGLEKEAEERREEAEEMERGKKREVEPITQEISRLEEEIRGISSEIKAIEHQKSLRQKERGDEEKVQAENQQPAVPTGPTAGAQQAQQQQPQQQQPPMNPHLARRASYTGEDEDVRLEREWQARQKGLEMRYIDVFNHFRHAQEDYFRSNEMLRAWQQNRRGSASSGPPPMPVPQPETPLKGGKSRKGRNRNRNKSRTQTVSSPIAMFPIQDGMGQFPMSGAFGPNLTTSPTNTMPPTSLPPGYQGLLPPAPFFNFNNTTIARPSSSDMDRLTAGAQMSPTADSLLPSNLFGADDGPPSPQRGTTSLDGEVNSFFPTAQSPGSSNSLSNSHMSSPRSSFPQFPSFTSEEGKELDRSNSVSSMNNNLRGIGPSTSEENPSGTKRFANLFSFNRPRGKTLSHEPPVLGSLKGNQSQSYPKKDGAELDPIGTRRRSGSHGSSWMSASHLNFLSNGHKSGSTSESPVGAPGSGSGSGSRATYNHFDPGYDPIEPSKLISVEPTSPRPASIGSFENPLPKPSSDFSAFGWGPASASDAFHAIRGSPLNTNWTDLPNINNNHHNHPASSNLPPSPHSSSVHAHPSRMAKIFSPSSSSHNRPNSPKLNPAAPTFEGTFQTPHSADGGGKGSDSLSIGTGSDVSLSGSVERHSLSTDRDASGSSVGKESLFSRFSLARKGSSTKLANSSSSHSSSKFNISSPFKKEGGLFSRSKKEAGTNESTSPNLPPEDGEGRPSSSHNNQHHNNNNLHYNHHAQAQQQATLGHSGTGVGSAGSASEMFGSWKRESSEILSPWKKEGGFFGVIGGGKKKKGDKATDTSHSGVSETDEEGHGGETESEGRRSTSIQQISTQMTMI